MRRRHFILNSGILSVGYLFVPLPIFSISRTLPQGFWMDITNYARWTASPHNMQPWKLVVYQKDEAILYYVPERLLPQTDPTSCFTIAGLSMFIENLSIAANSFGYQISPDYLTDQPLDYSAASAVPYATLRVVPADIRESLPCELMLKRKTSRMHYNDLPVQQQALSELQELSNDFDHTFNFSNEQEMVEWVMELNRITLFEDLDNEPVRNELDHLFRYTKKDAAARPYGLSAECMRFPGWLMKDFFQKPEKYSRPKRKQLLGNIYKKSMNGTRTIGWLSGKFDTPEDWRNAGRLLARFWLHMTKYNISMQPFGSVITNPIAHKILNDKIKTENGEQKLWLLMRMGYSKEPPASQRLRTEEIIQFK